MMTKAEIFKQYIKERFNEDDVVLNAPLRDTIEFQSYMLRIRWHELCQELCQEFKRIVGKYKEDK